MCSACAAQCVAPCGHTPQGYGSSPRRPKSARRHCTGCQGRPAAARPNRYLSPAAPPARPTPRASCRRSPPTPAPPPRPRPLAAPPRQQRQQRHRYRRRRRRWQWRWSTTLLACATRRRIPRVMSGAPASAAPRPRPPADPPPLRPPRRSPAACGEGCVARPEACVLRPGSACASACRLPATHGDRERGNGEVWRGGKQRIVSQKPETAITPSRAPAATC